MLDLIPEPILQLFGRALTPFANAAADRLLSRQFHQITSSRQRSIGGFWAGTAEDQYVESGPLITMPVSCSVKMSGHKVTAEATATPPETVGPPIKLLMTGGFSSEELVQLSYRSVDPVRVQFGVVILKLSATGETLHGNYAGFSPARECLIAGKLTFKRVSV
jgi:hypothetical protein